jgi:outer membrane beta-barrel protein
VGWLTLGLVVALGPRAALASSTGSDDCVAPPTTPDEGPATSSDSTEDVAAGEPPTDADPIEPSSPASVPPEVSAAAAPPPATAAEALGRTPRRVKCLDESLIDEAGRARVRKGVQPRYFRKARRVALSLGGGVWAGDLLDTSWHAQANLAFWPTEAFGIDADVKLTPMTFRLERSATGFTGANRYPDGIVDNFAYVAMGHVLFAPLHTKQRAGKERVRHGDFALFAGGGRAFHDSTQGIGFDLGVSLYWYVAKFVSIRLDVSDVILSQDVFGSRRISNNLVLSSGVGFWIPPRRRS